MHVCICAYTYPHVQTHIYIYIYISLFLNTHAMPPSSSRQGCTVEMNYPQLQRGAQIGLKPILTSGHSFWFSDGHITQNFEIFVQCLKKRRLILTRSVTSTASSSSFCCVKVTTKRRSCLKMKQKSQKAGSGEGSQLVLMT